MCGLRVRLPLRHSIHSHAHHQCSPKWLKSPIPLFLFHLFHLFSWIAPTHNTCSLTDSISVQRTPSIPITTHTTSTIWSSPNPLTWLEASQASRASSPVFQGPRTLSSLSKCRLKTSPTGPHNILSTRTRVPIWLQRRDRMHH